MACQIQMDLWLLMANSEVQKVMATGMVAIGDNNKKKIFNDIHDTHIYTNLPRTPSFSRLISISIAQSRINF